MKILMLITILFSLTSQAATLIDVHQLQRQLNINQINSENIEDIKIAILDNGFLGFQADGKTLPRNAQLIEGIENPQKNSDHGLRMANIVWELTGKNENGPQFYLINTNGFTNFQAAIEKVIQLNVDIVLYSQVWEWGGNFDGTGFINHEISKAINEGIIWINATGDPHNLIYTGKTRYLDSIIKFNNKLDNNTVNITLTWTDFQNDPNYTTTDDLGFEIFNSEGQSVAHVDKIQSGISREDIFEQESESGSDAAAEEARKYSSYPKESAAIRLDRGDYKIRVYKKGTVVAREFRVIIRSDKLQSLQITNDDGIVGRQEILIPADHRDVIAVGHFGETSAIDSESIDIRVPVNSAKFSDGQEIGGSSVSASAFAAKTIVLAANDTDYLDLDFLKTNLPYYGGFNQNYGEIIIPTNEVVHHRAINDSLSHSVVAYIGESSNDGHTFLNAIQIDGSIEDTNIYQRIIRNYPHLRRQNGLRLFWFPPHESAPNPHMNFVIHATDLSQQGVYIEVIGD